MNNTEEKKPFRIYGIYDTETCNIGTGNETRAYPILFIYNDVHNIDIADYVYDTDTDAINFYRLDTEFLNKIDQIVETGKKREEIPIICAYNLMFDLQPLMYNLSKKYRLKANAQTATSAYTVDLCNAGEEILLRFWDVFYLEMNGLAAMGETCGVPKARGDWDYTKIRTPYTPLTELELHYARRDVQVIPAYLAWLIHANDWLDASMLGSAVLTKTSLVRQFAKRQIGKLTYPKDNERGYVTLQNSFERTCEQELPKTFRQYALRKACFRGGLTFTAANYANTTQYNVASLDVTSMHHTFINGRYIPVHFSELDGKLLDKIAYNIIHTPLDTILRSYHKPFYAAVHVHIRLTNLRLREDTIFARAGIGILPESKFTIAAPIVDIQPNERDRAAEENIRQNGYKDYAERPQFAFGKLVRADMAEVYCNEIELWCISQVYEYDTIECLDGEASAKFVIPPDYVTLQSNNLFEQKQAMKTILKHYREGERYTREIPTSIPEGIAAELRAGTADIPFLTAYYNSTVKGMFNGIYGTQAMDVFKPDYIVREGELVLDKATICNDGNFMSRMPKTVRVLYTYGMRIVAGSRMHLVIALMLLDRYFGADIRPTGGDTDSIKCACADTITDDDLAAALKPLADASDNAIAVTQSRVRRLYPQMCSTLEQIGHFDIESAGAGTRWEYHFEAWNKARISMSENNYHITCAGLSRPRGMYHIEQWAHDMATAGYDFTTIARAIFGYNTFVDNSVSHALEHYRPHVIDRYRGTVTDYLGGTYHVDAPQSIALYPAGRWLGETTKRAPNENAKYIRSIGGYIEDVDKTIIRDGDRIYCYQMNDMGVEEPVMIGEVSEK